MCVCTHFNLSEQTRFLASAFLTKWWSHKMWEEEESKQANIRWEKHTRSHSHEAKIMECTNIFHIFHNGRDPNDLSLTFYKHITVPYTHSKFNSTKLSITNEGLVAVDCDGNTLQMKYRNTEIWINMILFSVKFPSSIDGRWLNCWNSNRLRSIKRFGSEFSINFGAVKSRPRRSRSLLMTVSTGFSCAIRKIGLFSVN